MATFTRDNIKPPIRQEVMGIANQNYYSDGHGNVVTEEDESQAYLIVGKGCEITKDMVEKFGDFNKVAQDEAADDADEPSKKSKETKTKGAK